LIRNAVEERLLKFGLCCHPEKTRIVYCKQDGRDEEYPVTSFTFLGFDFRRAPIRRRDGVLMCGFVPLVGKAALKSMAREIRQWKLGRWTSLSFRGLAAVVNPIVSGWINYYGRFYKSRLMHLAISSSECITSVEQLIQHFCGSLEAQRLPRSPVQLRGDVIEFDLSIPRQVRSFRKILPQQAIGVLIASSLPR
jgi:hypothetical protein